jgi:hypothetical protein
MITDTNVYLSRWPFRRLRGDEPAQLVEMLRKKGVTEAWAGSFDALLHEDVSEVNVRLARDCREFGPGFLTPFGTVNLRLPDWQEDLRRCHEVHGMPGIRIHPNYQYYKLTDPAFTELLGMIVERKMILQIAAGMEDERTQHPVMRAPDLNFEPLPALLKAHPRARLQLLAMRRAPSPLVKALGAAADVYFDFSWLESVGTLSRLCEAAPGHVAFGSHSPYIYFESAQLKIQEAGLTGAQLTSVLTGAAARLRNPAAG